ncbi:MAG: hypothetical protein OXQ94_15030 [Gemmatimonadota bacterium]|nr:hypothetical protein [Gemmatimonadota bacterium]MDE2872990.1 hypothetical protein [Gemmatimonadota bacterium]
MHPILPRIFLIAIAAATTTCEITEPEVPLDLDSRLVLVAALNPDSTRHPVVVWPAQTLDTVKGTVVRIYREKAGPSEREWTLVGETDQIEEDWTACARRYGNPINDTQCLVPTATLEDGVTYRVEVFAEEKDTAWGATTAVGGFEVKSAELFGEGADTLNAEWTEAVAAHRYMVSLRELRAGNVFRPYVDGWYVAVDGTSVTTPVPEDTIEKAVTPLTLDVAAMEVHLYSFITSGNGGSAFSVPPIQNIVGGFGVVGSVRYRSMTVNLK